MTHPAHTPHQRLKAIRLMTDTHTLTLRRGVGICRERSVGLSGTHTIHGCDVHNTRRCSNTRFTRRCSQQRQELDSEVEQVAHIDIHDLLPCFVRVLLQLASPRHTCVIDLYHADMNGMKGDVQNVGVSGGCRMVQTRVTCDVRRATREVATLV
jgi:hypothetical protein